MRNKENFNKDFESIAIEELIESPTFDQVEDASHTMRHTGENTYILPSQFSKTGRDVRFIFEKHNRPATEDSSLDIEDYFYIEKREI